MKKNKFRKALDPIASLLEDPSITEIMVDGPDRITVERPGGTMEAVNASFPSNDAVKDMIEAVLESVGMELEDDKSIYEARLPDNSRMIAVLAPTAINGHSVIFRKFMVNQITWEKLVEYRCVTAEIKQFFQSALAAHVNILIAGGTASGKTTLANRIIELIPPHERIVAVEQAHEFQIDHPCSVFLEADDAMHANINDLLTAGSKMRPDWLAVGELHGAEAMRAMQIFSNGHWGITLIHANNIENALTRLEGMCLMANLGLGLDDIRGMIASALKLLVYQEYLPSRKRKVTHIAELRGLENGRYVIQPLMRYNPENDQFEFTNAKPSWQM